MFTLYIDRFYFILMSSKLSPLTFAESNGLLKFRQVHLIWEKRGGASRKCLLILNPSIQT